MGKKKVFKATQMNMGQDKENATAIDTKEIN